MTKKFNLSLLRKENEKIVSHLQELEKNGLLPSGVDISKKEIFLKIVYYVSYWEHLAEQNIQILHYNTDHSYGEEPQQSDLFGVYWADFSPGWFANSGFGGSFNLKIRCVTWICNTSVVFRPELRQKVLDRAHGVVHVFPTNKDLQERNGNYLREVEMGLSALGYDYKIFPRIIQFCYDPSYGHDFVATEDLEKLHNKEQQFVTIATDITNRTKIVTTGRNIVKLALEKLLQDCNLSDRKPG